ncbi:arrestin domain-containing protein 1, partial [Nematolebias whitei]|uniref:arrestin domain-containing protein 1 n=1 Tax=Nematolebias whitei TaxID=451745 RepID=UPI001899D5FA
MGKLQEFEIEFDKNKVVYAPGESISGTVRVKVNQSVQCKAIKVNCNGFCGITTKENDINWTLEEQYFNSSVSVADKGTLKQGEHAFPFKFLIPATAPTSFEGNYGRIIYRVRAFIDTPRFTKDYNTEKSFYLLSLLNLNEVPDIWMTLLE